LGRLLLNGRVVSLGNVRSAVVSHYAAIALSLFLGCFSVGTVFVGVRLVCFSAWPRSLRGALSWIIFHAGAFISGHNQLAEFLDLLAYLFYLVRYPLQFAEPGVVVVIRRWWGEGLFD